MNPTIRSLAHCGLPAMLAACGALLPGAAAAAPEYSGRAGYSLYNSTFSVRDWGPAPVSMDQRSTNGFADLAFDFQWQANADRDVLSSQTTQRLARWATDSGAGGVPFPSYSEASRHGRLAVFGPATSSGRIEGTLNLRFDAARVLQADPGLDAGAGFMVKVVMVTADLGRISASFAGWTGAGQLGWFVTDGLVRNGAKGLALTMPLPVGEPLDLYLAIDTAVHANPGTVTGSVLADSFASLGLARDGSVFALPDGYTVRSTDWEIVENQWCPGGVCAAVPEPASAGLLLGGAALLALRRRRAALAAAALGAAGAAQAAGTPVLVDFDHHANGTPIVVASGQVLRDDVVLPYLAEFGISITERTRAGTEIRIGNLPQSGATSGSNTFHAFAPTVPAASPYSYRIVFAQPVDSLSFMRASLVGAFTSHDGWQITAYDQAGTVLGSVSEGGVAQLGGTLEAQARRFDLPYAGIGSLLVLGNLSTGGQTFESPVIDDLRFTSPAAVPEPPAALLALAGALVLAARRRGGR